MKFNPRRSPHSCTTHNGDRWPPPPLGRGPAVDVNHWLDIAEADIDMPASAGGSLDGLRSLRRDLLAGLGDDDVSLVPASAGDLSPDEWHAMGAEERASYQAVQLAHVDPRLVPRATVGGSVGVSPGAEDVGQASVGLGRGWPNRLPLRLAGFRRGRPGPRRP